MNKELCIEVGKWNNSILWCTVENTLNYPVIYTTQGDVRDETFDTCVFWLRAIVSSSPNIGAEGPPLVACPRLLIQYNRISRTSPPATWRLTQKSCPATRKSLALCQCELCQVNPSNSFLSRVLPPLLISSLCAVWCRFRLRDCKFGMHFLFSLLAFCLSRA